MQLDARSLRFDALAEGPDDGPLVLLLHGFPQTGACWSKLLPRLAAEGYRAVAPDQRGYSPGARPAGRRAYHLRELAADAIGIADALGAERFHVVGHDWGGAVAWVLAADHADRLRTATVVATPHPAAFAHALRRPSQLARSTYMGFFQLPWVPEAVLTAAGGAVLRRALVRSGLPADAAAAYTAAMTGGALGPALNWYRANGPGTATRVGPARVPTRYVWPSDDVALGRAAAEATAAHVDAPYRFAVLDGCPHWVPEVAPDALATHVLDHLAR